MNAFEVYSQFIALKQHFTTTYDYQKYGGKTRASVKAFESRKDKGFFVSLARRHSDPFHYMLANFVADQTWIGDFTEDIYLSWRKKQESLSYLFRSELGEMNPDFDSNFVIVNGWPEIFQLHSTKHISLETLTILLDITNIWAYYNKYLADDILWPPLEMKARKYLPFLQKLSYDRAKFRGIILDYFEAQ